MRSVNRIFINFLTAYTVLILIPLIAGIFMNGAIVREYEHHVRHSHLTHLKKTQDVLESFIDDIKWSTYQLAGNAKLQRLISDKDRTLSEMERSSLIRETMMELRNSLLYNTSFNSVFYVFLKDQDTIITPYSIYTHSDFNDSINFFQMDGISSVEWHSAISTRFFHGSILPVRSVLIEDFKNKRMIPYVQTLPVDLNRDIRKIEGAIVYLIGEADFISLLDHEELPPGSVSYIADEQNNLISLVSKGAGEFKPLDLEGDEGMMEWDVDGSRMFVIYTTSQKNKWKYVSVLPEEWVLKSVKYYQIISALVMLIALVFCLFAAYSLSQRWSEPIMRSFNSISGYLKKEEAGQISFRSLNSNVNELIHYSEGMQDELLDQQVFVHNAFVNRLINGFFRNEKNLQSYLEHLGFSISEKYFSIAVFFQEGVEGAGTTESFDEMVRVNTILKLQLQQEFPLRLMISDLENSGLVLILMTSSGSSKAHEEAVEQALGNYCSTLPSLYTDNLTIALGETVESLMKVHSSYLQAMEVLSRSDGQGSGNIIHYRVLDSKLEDYYFPLELESQLINAVKAGNTVTVAELLSSLYSENMEKRVLESQEQELFLSALLNAGFRVLSQVSDSVKEDLTSVPDRYNPQLDFQSIKGFLEELCGAQNRNKKSHNVSLIDKVQDFLQKNYINRNLSLLMVAEHFSLSESYLSSFFKEQTGTNFSTYLEKIRIENARELLSRSDEPIHIIAGKVGYNSDKTFRRVFQKIYKISPGQFRESLKS
ncbi:MAG: helix-turn-helix domain-containing protein [Spirochaetales bacterium]|nr:helix-turn-helix domain-containing protein [Spirochaetales bacterium]